jgi:uncharacterized membrane protein YfcA
MNEILALTLVSGITGLISGIIGAGPEVLIVPLLTFMGIMPSIKHRIGTSLFMLLPPIGLGAAINYYNKGFVNVKSALYMSLIFTVFASITSYYSVDLNTEILKKIFAIFTILVGIYYFIK